MRRGSVVAVTGRRVLGLAACGAAGVLGPALGNARGGAQPIFDVPSLAGRQDQRAVRLTAVDASPRKGD